jgi:hypothetical protein
MSYYPCAKACWTKLFTSFQPFSSRVIAQFQQDLRHSWASAYKKGEKHPQLWSSIVVWLIGQTLKGIAQTAKALLVIVVGIGFYIVGFIFCLLRCLILPCPLSNAQPDILNFDDFFYLLNNEVNKELSGLDKITAPIFTPFKETGLSNSWDDYDYWVIVKGDIINLTDSWDGIKTLDMKLINLAVFDHEQSLLATENLLWYTDFTAQNPKFIRVEVYPHVPLVNDISQVQVSETLDIKGRLRWDRDGFLEIHPK